MVNANKKGLRRRLPIRAAPKNFPYEREIWKTVIHPSLNVDLVPCLKKEIIQT